MTRPSSTERLAAQLVPSLEELERATPDRAVALGRILAEPGGAGRVRAAAGRTSAAAWRRPVTVFGAGAVAVALAVIVGFLTSGVTSVATPALLTFNVAAVDTADPAVLLRQLADRAAAQPPVAGTGRYDYVHTRGWYFDTQTSDTGTTGRIDPTEREQWIAADGAGRIEETRSGARSPFSQVYPAGGLYRPAPLPTDPVALERLLAQSHPDYGTSEWFIAVNDVWGPQLVEPPLQAALLRLLATKPDMTVRGAVTDRVGRPGVAVGTRSDHAGVPTDYTLVFDNDTGALLDFEQVALEAGEFPIQAPATISYTVWLSSGRTDSTDARP